jgi:hypothetical protein
MIINFLVPLKSKRGSPPDAPIGCGGHRSFKTISRRRNRETLQGGSLIANVTDATVFARHSPIAFQQLLPFHSCTLLRRVAHGRRSISRAS